MWRRPSVSHETLYEYKILTIQTTQWTHIKWFKNRNSMQPFTPATTYSKFLAEMFLSTRCFAKQFCSAEPETRWTGWFKGKPRSLNAIQWMSNPKAASSRIDFQTWSYFHAAACQIKSCRPYMAAKIKLHEIWMREIYYALSSAIKCTKVTILTSQTATRAPKATKCKRNLYFETQQRNMASLNFRNGSKSSCWTVCTSQVSAVPAAKILRLTDSKCSHRLWEASVRL